MKIYTIETADNAVAPARLMNVVGEFTKAIELARGYAERGPEKLLRSFVNEAAKTTVYINAKTNVYARITEWEV